MLIGYLSPQKCVLETFHKEIIKNMLIYALWNPIIIVAIYSHRHHFASGSALMDSVRSTSNCLWQFPLTAKAVSWRSTMSHTKKCLKYGISHLDLWFRKAESWELQKKINCRVHVKLKFHTSWFVYPQKRADGSQRKIKISPILISLPTKAGRWEFADIIKKGKLFGIIYRLFL